MHKVSPGSGFQLGVQVVSFIPNILQTLLRPRRIRHLRMMRLSELLILLCWLAIAHAKLVEAWRLLILFSPLIVSPAVGTEPSPLPWLCAGEYA